MRLIDADKYCDFLNRYPLEKAQNNSMVFYREALQETFKYEVEAIPIEWFEWLLDTMGDGMYNLRAVIKDWERYKEDWGKENEIN